MALPVAPPQLSAAEIKQLEDEASWTLKQFLATAVVLYICMSSLLPSLYHPLPACLDLFFAK